MTRPRPLLIVVLLLAGCAHTPLRQEVEAPAAPQPLAPVLGGGGAAAPRVNGGVGRTETSAPAELSFGHPGEVAVPSGAVTTGGGDIRLDFADTDIRQVVAQILGTILRVNYTIDPAVHGTVTLHTTTPLARSQMLPVLQTLLGQVGAGIAQSDGLVRVVPAAAATTPGLAGGPESNGAELLPLRYVSATDLAKVLQPFAGNGARVIAEPASNALLVSGDPAARAALAGLVAAFDTDVLAGQSYALLPVPEGGAKDFASALQDAFRTQAGGGLSGVVRVAPMDRINSVLVIASAPSALEQARRIYGLIQNRRRLTVRSWHVYYLQDSHAQDAAYVLQQAFTPNAVTAQPTETASGQASQGYTQQMRAGGGFGGGGFGGGAGGGIGGISGGGGIGTGASLIGGGGGGLPGGNANPLAVASGTAPPQGGGAPAQTSANPLLGGLDSGNAGNGVDTNTMRIVPNSQNNALLVYATQQEEETVEAMLRKIDILPLQVRIDATIAEVTLNDALQYGTQFFFKSGGINGILNNTPTPTPLGSPVNTVLSTSFPGFILGGTGQGGAPIALQALQAVTTVHVLSSPELLVLDNQPARLQVGDLVPYLTSTSQSTLLTGAPVINSVNYQPTGVIMNVTPRVNSGGLVTLDISQEVSAIDTSVTQTTTGIASPTFSERNITSRVVVQDGQTVGLAGLITDSVTRGNSGLPFLKDIPILGLLAGTQNNTRTRTELLVLITPHVLHDQRDARALTLDLQQQLPEAAGVPTELQRLRPSGSNDPSRNLRRKLDPDQ